LAPTASPQLHSAAPISSQSLCSASLSSAPLCSPLPVSLPSYSASQSLPLHRSLSPLPLSLLIVTFLPFSLPCSAVIPTFLGFPESYAPPPPSTTNILVTPVLTHTHTPSAGTMKHPSAPPLLKRFSNFANQTVWCK
jgi:hypothetical protein